jgi:hypothetical protein
MLTIQFMFKGKLIYYMIKADKHFFYIVHHPKSVSIIWKNITCLYFFGPLISNKNVIFVMKVKIFDSIICRLISFKITCYLYKKQMPGIPKRDVYFLSECLSNNNRSQFHQHFIGAIAPIFLHK